MIQKLFPARWWIFVLLLAVTIVTTVRMGILEQKVRRQGVPGFTIMQLEKPGTEQQLYAKADELRQHTATIYAVQNLKTDYWFMPACYGGIAVWLLNLRRKTKKWLSVILLIAAVLQALPWAFDLVENAHLLCVLNGDQLGMNFNLWKLMVGSKFFIAIGGAVIALAVSVCKLFLRRRVNFS